MSAKFLAALALVLVVCGVAKAGDNVSDNEDVKSSDVTVNIYKGSGVDSAGAKAAIDEANKILKQVGIRLNVSDERINTNVTKGDNGGGGGTAGDGKLTVTEFKWVVYYGDKEVDNGKKGMKISFADLTPMGTPGGAIHKHPTVVVQKQATTKKTGETIAHEILHALTLTGTYTIDAGTDADRAGHAPNKPGTSGNGNAMAPSSRRSGTAVTPDQKGKIDSDGYADRWSKTKKVDKKKAPSSPPATNQQQKGGGCATDPALLPTYLDLSRVGLGSDFGDAALTGLIAMQEIVPASNPFDASYLLDFETDGAHPGYDRQIQIDLSRALADDPVNVAAQVNNLETGGQTSFYDVALVEGLLGTDIEDPNPINLESQLEFNVGKDLLGVDSLTSIIQGQASTYDGIGQLSYSMPISLDLGWWLGQPDLLLTQGTVLPGELLSFQLTGLTPSMPFQLFLDDMLLPGGMTSPTGDYIGAFLVPGVAPDDYYFVTAVDSFGLSAYNAVYVVPEPATWLLVLCAALSVIPWRLRKRTP